LGDQVFDLLLWGGLVALLVVGFGAAEIHKLPLLFANSDNMRQFGKDFLHPDFSDWKLYIAQMWLTVQMALWGTFLAVMLAIPLGLAAGGFLMTCVVRRFGFVFKAWVSVIRTDAGRGRRARGRCRKGCR
jgi:ABC-type phosphate/phosphonate transport system permease subunit